MPYYLVKPNANLQTVLKLHPEMSLPPRLLKADDIKGLSADEQMESQKLFHLAGMADYLHILSDPDDLYSAADNEKRHRKYLVMKSLLGAAPYTRAVFDRWWTIERMNAMLSYEDVLKRLPISALEQVAESDSEALTAWLSGVIKGKKQREEK
jgi:hypothetical protein